MAGCAAVVLPDCVRVLTWRCASTQLSASTLARAEGAHAVHQMLTRLAQEGEEDWVGWISCELAVEARPALWPSLYGFTP